VRIAVDSSVLVALLDQRDLWRAKAQTLYDALLEADIIPVYFDCVAAEAISAAARRLHEKKRAAEVQGLLERLKIQVPRETLTWILPDVPRLYPEVLALIDSSSGELNFNDALIALTCRERDIPAIASFDADFDQIPWLKRVARDVDVMDLLAEPGEVLLQ
jgi:predicted nucleic acid-binding protein